MQSLALVIPLKNEESSVEALVKSIKDQSFKPNEIIMVDGGSTDNTVQVLKKLTNEDGQFHLIETKQAMPGKGRNIGAEYARSEWIAFTDAGISLDKHWLENLVKKEQQTPGAGIVYGNFSPQINSFFDKCATITYVPAMRPGIIRSKFIASSLFKKEVWQKAGGFPDWRATEDLVFMEKAEDLNYPVAFAPDAMVYWQLRPDLNSTYKKFELYSRYNVWAGRQAVWHYGIARQYIVMLIAVLIAFLFSWYWLLLLPVWICARVVKRIYSHREEFGARALFNPSVFLMVMLITLVIDAATFSGWIKAIVQRKDHRRFSLRQ